MTAVYNFVPDRIGFIKTHRLGILLGVPLCLLTPFLHLLLQVPVAVLWCGMFVFACAWCIVDNLSFASVLVLVANSAPKSQLGQVNGIGQSGVALVRAIGPVMGGWMYAQSMLWDSPLAVWTVFLFQALVKSPSFFFWSGFMVTGE